MTTPDPVSDWQQKKPSQAFRDYIRERVRYGKDIAGDDALLLLDRIEELEAARRHSPDDKEVTADDHA